ncbi:NAD(P)-binding protein [Durotheca rogersii]|uniref:NAD(P)-binding protein n=1 Tax=Durotheca rogersii TaxID=419775 RepID=UPI00221FB191|nr:NAD(P)-binding protein [Durotheca rogersii]KAI5859259.1 NAD(P)-binding protein [Durotheca rogersii]
MSHDLENEAQFEGSILGFLYRQWTPRKQIPKGTNLSGQTAIVTGSNSGLGLEAARQLLQMGLECLVMGVRSQARGDTAAGLLREEFPDSTVSVWLLDMESYDSVTSFARRCETLPRIDIVLLNAGMRGDAFRVVEITEHEQSFQVNYLSTALLTILLLPTLKSKRLQWNSPPPRLSIVSSDTALWASLETSGPIFAQFDKPESFYPMRNYQRGKLLQLFFTAKLAGSVSAEDVIINASNPGYCKGTDFDKGRKFSVTFSILMGLLKLATGRTVEVGASTLVDAVVMHDKASHGSYVSDWAIRPFPEMMYKEGAQDVSDRIWEETLEELNFAGVSQIVRDMQR